MELDLKNPNISLPDKIGDDEAKKFFEEGKGPFMNGLRVNCPLKRFAPRKSSKCFSCECFLGVFEREMSGYVNVDDPRINARRYGIICHHPMNRSLSYFEEEE